tara:strand:+ start:235 stop:669 length:435 start_codon:yes stop_codon:yes gene_type:complete
MNKIFLLIFIPIIFILSCSTEKSDARLSLENYLLNIKNEEFQSAYLFLSSNVKENCKFNDFKKNATNNYDAIRYSMLVYSGESNSEGKANVSFIIKIDDNKVNLFDMQILDPYLEEETARLVFEDNKWALNNLIWPIDWCEEMK